MVEVRHPHLFGLQVLPVGYIEAFRKIGASNCDSDFDVDMNTYFPVRNWYNSTLSQRQNVSHWPKTWNMDNEANLMS